MQTNGETNGEKVRFGVIGLGNQGTTYILNLFDKGEIPNGFVAAACDINPVKIENIKAKTKNTGIVYFTASGCFKASKSRLFGC